MDKILIKKNPNGDTRTAPRGITFEQFAEANDSHMADVSAVMTELAMRLDDAGQTHDNTKKSLEKEFYRDFKAAMNDELNFVEGPWYQAHIHQERHHPLSYCHPDLNLLDVLEMVVDCTVAGLARSGKVRPMEINANLLNKAVANTVTLIQSMVEVQ